MDNQIKEILDYLKDKNDYVEDFGISYKRIHIDNGDLKLLLDYITNLQQENEKLKGLTFIQHEEYEKLFNHLIIDKPRERIKKAINIYNNRNSLKYKKQRFMQGKSTADLMYETLQNGSDN